MNREDCADLPGLLLVEDDPTTRAYLLALSQALPAQVETAASVSEAVALAQARPHALWMIDANLPDGDGAGLLARLRALGLRTPALAHTAARDRATLDALLSAGFVQALSKPIDAATWRAALLAALGRDAPVEAPIETAVDADALPLWDNDAAARALGGDPSHVAALRTLFLAELPAQAAAIAGADAQAARAQLHRLRASCALVGAARLDAAVRQLQDAPESGAARAAFAHAAQATLDQPPGS